MKTTLVIAGAFALALVAPLSVSAQQAPAQGYQTRTHTTPDEPTMQRRWMHRLGGVNLSGDQQQRISSLIDRYARTHPAGSPTDRAGNHALRRQIMSLLSPDQQQQYRQMMRQRRAEMQQRRAQMNGQSQNQPYDQGQYQGQYQQGQYQQEPSPQYGDPRYQQGPPDQGQGPPPDQGQGPTPDYQQGPPDQGQGPPPDYQQGPPDQGQGPPPDQGPPPA